MGRNWSTTSLYRCLNKFNVPFPYQTNSTKGPNESSLNNRAFQLRLEISFDVFVSIPFISLPKLFHSLLPLLITAFNNPKEYETFLQIIIYEVGGSSYVFWMEARKLLPWQGNSLRVRTLQKRWRFMNKLSSLWMHSNCL